MEYRVTQETADRNKGVTICDRPNQFDHRGMVLRATCEIENEFADLLLTFFKMQNPTFAEVRARKDLFSENGLLNSLNRMTKLGSYLGLVSADEAHDFRSIARLRNQFAHGPRRDQFYRDSDAAAAVRALKLVCNSEEVFAGFDEQGIFLACQEHLVAMLRDRGAGLARVSGAV